MHSGQLGRADVERIELGHNLGRGHAPCGNPGYLDLEYPYPDGTIGGFGYDAAQDVWITPDRRDFMSYCLYNWTSDYTFSQIVDWDSRTPTRPLRSWRPPTLRMPPAYRGCSHGGASLVRGSS